MNPPYFVRSGPVSWDDVPPSIRRHAAALGLTTPPPPGARSLPPGPSPLTPLPRGFPRRLPADGRVRVGVFSPGAYLGGAERHISDLLDHCDGSRLSWAGIAIQGSPTIPTIPSVLADWEAHCPVGVGEHAMRALARGVDVLVSWGFRSAHLATLIPPGMPVIEISHCAWERNQDQCSLPGGTVVAVAASAMKAVPPGRRASARVIHNAVHPDRVRPVLDRADQKRAWGIPVGAKVAGWLGRVAREKRPELYIDGIARLPAGWYGVMVGTGLQEEEARAHAARVCPGRVVFPGPTADVGSALRAFDSFVMTSGAEGCCYALAEAWAAGVPAISCEVGLLEERPDLARLLPIDPTGADVAAAILADADDRAGTRGRVSRATEYAGQELGMGKFGGEWTDVICGLAPPPPATIPLDRSIELMRLRRECPHASKAAGCGCQDLVACSKNNRDMTRPECYACLGADA